jgi:branched-chain amino acid transport system ATP-binding protein
VKVEPAPPRVTGRVREFVSSLGPNGVVPLAILTGVAAVERFDDVAFGVLAPEIRHAFHLTNAKYVAIATLTSVLPLLLAVPTGYLGDRTHRVNLSRIGALVWGVTAIFTGLAPTVWFLIVARLAGGTGQLVNEPIHASLLADYYPPKSLGSVFGAYRLGSTGLALVGAPMAGVIATAVGWRTAFVVLAVPTLVMVAVMVKLREPARGESLALALPDEDLPTMAEGFRRVRAILTLRRTWVAAFLFGGASVPFDNYLNLYLDEVFHLSASTRGVITGLYGIGSLFGLIAGGALAQRVMDRKREDLLPAVIAVMAFELSVGAVFMAIAPNSAFAVVAIMIAAIGTTGFLPAYQTLVSIISPPRLRAQAFAWSLLWYGLGAIVIGTLVGAFGDAHGQRPALVFLAVLVVGAGIAELTCRQFVHRDVKQAIRHEETSHTDALLACSGLDISYDGTQVLFGVDLEIHEHEIVALLGTNGAGKSTLLRAISGLVDPVGGAIFYAGRDITHADATVTARLGIVQVPGGRGIFPSLSVGDNLRVAGWLQRREDAWTAESIDRVKTLFPVLAARWDEAAGNLSGGEQQMLSLAQAMLARPKLLLVDELSLGLAPKVVDALLEVVAEIHKAGTAVIIVEQSVTIALRFAKRAVFMEKGEIRFDGPSSRLLARRDLLRSVFLGRGERAVSSNGGRATTKEQRRRSSLLAGEPVLEVREISKHYGGVTALDEVSLTLHDGQILGVIGPNGAGKTSLFDVICGFQTADSGRVILGPQDVTAWTPAARAAAGLGRSFQDARLFPSLTVRESLAVACERANTGKAILAAALHLPQVQEAETLVAERVERIIELLGLEAFANKFVSELSTGSRRIVELGAIVAHQPSVVILDEPSSGIAQREAEALGPLLRSIQDELGASLLVVEHDMALIGSLADHLVALDRGRVIAQGLPTDVLSDALVVDAYLGDAGKRRTAPRKRKTTPRRRKPTRTNTAR